MHFSFLFLVALATTANGRSVSEEGKKFLKDELDRFLQCAKDANLPPEETLEQFVNKRPLQSTREIKCISLCHLKSMGIIKEDGALDWGRLDGINRIEYTEAADLDKALKASSNCQKIVPSKNGGDLCDYAFIATKCYLEETKKLNLRLLSVEDA